MRIITLFAICILTAATATTSVASAGSDPVAACRAAYADDPTAHIACLESALTRLNETGSPMETTTKQPSGLGADQVIKNERIKADVPAEQATVHIISATYNAQGLGVFRLSDGQIWRETVTIPSHQQLKPDQQYQARIERAILGGYRMYVDGVRPMLKVERIK